MTLDVGNNVRLKVIETLGHASHHQSYYETLGKGVFPGDAAGVYLKEFDAVVPTTPVPFRLDSTLASLDRLINLKPRALYYSHFGEASDPAKRLRAYKSQLKLWARIAREGTKNKQGLEAVRERILESDENIRKTAEVLKAHPVLGETVLVNSVQGVMEFVEKETSGPE
jgi:glyoxylase-like metal-dependent hydrolase (beta-lactamase superfamily II)